MSKVSGYDSAFGDGVYFTNLPPWTSPSKLETLNAVSYEVCIEVELQGELAGSAGARIVSFSTTTWYWHDAPGDSTIARGG
eukprot:CAMPEP_0171128340 /NCGR_PEP_ID=MMETSP0766_2-20121228/116925_1 /TAXON_ID=439317 /ORGANISM="Gambierdiscus australes, Strain CAWD 149" /LENGTH=80 /DNA_ID=CAMNT_0011591497 /DNA_START=180 /DNA_END=420 /DNA_ORIENTATION=+